MNVHMRMHSCTHGISLSELKVGLHVGLNTFRFTINILVIIHQNRKMSGRKEKCCPYVLTSMCLSTSQGTSVYVSDSVVIVI